MKEKISMFLVRVIVSESMEFYKSERAKAERPKEVAFCTGAITALRLLLLALEKGVNNEAQ